jgi:hypothetical protein
MKRACGVVVLLAWWVYVAEPAAALDRQTGHVYPTFKWVAKERFLYRDFCRDFCESRAKEYGSTACRPSATT